MAASAKSVRAGKAYVELGADGSKLAAGLRSAETRLKAWGKSITEAGSKIALFGGVGLAGAATALKIFADMGSALVDLADTTGVGIEALQELTFTAEQSGANAEMLVTSLGRMQRTLVDAAGGSREANAALEGIGVSLDDLASMNPEQQFERIGAAIAGVENPAERTAAAMAIFGRAGARLIPTFQQLAAGRLTPKRIISEKEAKDAEAFGDSLSALAGELKKVVFVIGLQLLPIGKAVVAWLSEATGWVITFIDNNGGLINGLAIGAAAVAAFGGALVVLGGVVSAAGFALGGLMTALSAFRIITLVITAAQWAWAAVLLVIKVEMLLWQAAVWLVNVATTAYSVSAGVAAVSTAAFGVASAIASIAMLAFKGVVWLVNVAITVLTGGINLATIAIVALFVAINAIILAVPLAIAAFGLWLHKNEEISASVSNLGDVLSEMGATFQQVWGGIGAALSAGDLGAAAEIGWLGIKVAWTQGINWIRSVWRTFSMEFMNAWDAIVAQIAVSFSDAIGLIVNSFNQLLSRLPQRAQAALGGPIAWDAAANERDIRAELGRDQGIRRWDAFQAGDADAANLRRMQNELNDAVAAAEIMAGIAEADRMRRAAPGGQGGGMTRQLGATSRGTFSAAQLSAFGGGASSADRAARAAEQSLMVLQQVRDLMRNAVLVFQ